MEADENLTALKKAYADVILRITEEAAARVMVSERKSIKYQHELKVAKEEGVRMLLRLKHMMDAQTREAEAASSSQQDKIEELEAQLEEAEEIVSGLRRELEQAQGELARVRKGNLSHVNGAEGFCPREPLGENDRHSCPGYAAPFDLGVPCGNEGVLPSIISKNKEPGLYRNGCTQRIRACEWNHSKRDLCLLGETDKDKNDGEEKGDEASKAPTSGAKTVAKLQKKLVVDLGSTSCIRKRKRSTRLKFSITGSGRSRSYDSVKREQSAEDETAPYVVNTSSLGPSSCEENKEPQDQTEDAEAPDQVFSSEILNRKVVKFTYQRKKRKESSAGDEHNGSLDNDQRSGDVQSDNKKLRKYKSTESAQECRRLAQVARQLLSLSGKRWWG